MTDKKNQSQKAPSAPSKNAPAQKQQAGKAPKK